ncbi:tungsten-dependent formylmethanofuran dehydrogenase subunit FwdF [uncultured Methanobrevibacter sp.]|uniref:tungsten-dependent formylmethanofuran dehydrogenase subunit FwdF n=1 Tax=uncultured Methanobrevibacter sp. TaxID=253161 RepID=UPI0025E23D86|nr:tungsten-dependent formylmethanofuran dehydrogenase subunit FwdF [uncultured Methanobrevibacter sp.]
MIRNLKEVNDNNFDITRSAEEVRNLSFKDHVCIGCGICESTCPVGAIALNEIAIDSRARVSNKVYFSGHEKIAQNIHDEFDVQRISINEDKCVLCGMCSGLCPVDALVLTIDGVPISEIDAYPHYNAFSEIDDDECIYCKKCETACPRDAIVIDRTLPDRADLVTGEIEIDNDECVYCGICEELCPAEAIVVDKETGKESIEVDTSKCVYCLVCKKACPTNAIKALCRICSYGEYDIDLSKAAVKGNSVIDSELCVYCGWCEGVCPTDAAKTKKPFEGTIEVDQDKCQACGACVDICKCNALAFPVSTGKCKACAKACPNGAITVKRTEVDHTPTNSATWTDALNAIKD